MVGRAGPTESGLTESGRTDLTELIGEPTPPA